MDDIKYRSEIDKEDKDDYNLSCYFFSKLQALTNTKLILTVHSRISSQGMHGWSRSLTLKAMKQLTILLTIDKRLTRLKSLVKDLREITEC